MKEIWFHDIYKSLKDEKLSTVISAHKFGWLNSNPGPIVAYPINMLLFPNGIPDTIPAKTVLAVPWTQARIVKEIELNNELIKGRKETLKRSIKALKKNTKEINQVATTVDVIAAVLMLNVGLGSAAISAKNVMSGTKAAISTAASTLGEAQAIVRNLKLAGTGATYAGVQTLVGLDPGAFVGRGQSLLQVTARHVLSITSPSYWASLFASAWTGDWDLWKYGAKGIQNREIASRLKIFQKEVGGFYLIAALDRQHQMYFYKYHIAQSSQVYLPPPLSACLA